MATAVKQIAALNDQIEIDVPSDKVAAGSVQLPAGWAGTVVVEATDDGNTYTAIGLTPAAGGAVVGIAAATGLWTFGPIAVEKIRARVSVAGAGGKAALTVSNY